MQKLSKSNRHLFLLVTYAIVLYVGLQNLSIVRKLLGWMFAIVEPIVYGLSIAFVINLIMNIFRRKLFYRLAKSKDKWKRNLVTPLCVTMTILVVGAIIAAIVFLIIPQVTTAINLLIEKMPSSSDQLYDVIHAKLIAWNAPQFILDEVESFNMDWSKFLSLSVNFFDGKFDTIVGTAFNATASVISTFTNLLLGFIIAIYILAKKQRVLYVCRKLTELAIPEKYHEQTFRIFHLTNKSFASFLTGQITEAIIIGSLCTVGLTIFQFPYAAAIGILTGLTALIPIIGAWIGGGIGLLLVWVDSPEKAFWFVVFIVVLQQLEGQFIYPKVVGDSLGLPGLLVLVAVILGGSFSGIVGIILAVPLAAIIYTLLKESIDKMPNKDEGTDESSSDTDKPSPVEEHTTPSVQRIIEKKAAPPPKPQPPRKKRTRKH